jgi:phytoene dehydrogenase-like protein
MQDAVVVGAGPNGLAAAITLAREGWSVRVLEAAGTPGGGSRTAELTLPGYRHDVCSAVHPMAAASPFLRGLDLAARGVRLIHPDAPLAHPLDGGRAAILEGRVEATAAGLGADAGAWRRLFGPLGESLDGLLPDLLGPLRPLPAHPLALARFGALALLPAATLARLAFRGERARALFAGIAAHSILPLSRPVSSAAALLLGAMGQTAGWPIVAGGSGELAAALAAELEGLGGEIECGRPVASTSDLPSARAILLDLHPRGVLAVAGERLPPGYRRRLQRYRGGPGVFKLDWALRGPIPWRAPECARAASVHVGGGMDEIAAGEAEVWRGGHPERPFVILSQPSLFDPSRAPAGGHTAWGYCHVPAGSPVDMTARIEAQIERFAPGFRDLVLARAATPPAALEAYDGNYVGGDIAGGVQDLGQLFTRPVARLDPYSTPDPGLWICSASTPPGGGVHGMCGYHAARSVLRRAGRRQ